MEQFGCSPHRDHVSVNSICNISVGFLFHFDECDCKFSFSLLLSKKFGDNCLLHFQNRYAITVPKISCKRDSSYLSEMNCSSSGPHGNDFSVHITIKPDVVYRINICIRRQSPFCFPFTKMNVQFYVLILDESVRLSSRYSIYGHEQHYNRFVSIFHRNGYIERNEYCCWRFKALLERLSSVPVFGSYILLLISYWITKYIFIIQLETAGSRIFEKLHTGRRFNVSVDCSHRKIFGPCLILGKNRQRHNWISVYFVLGYLTKIFCSTLTGYMQTEMWQKAIKNIKFYWDPKKLFSKHQRILQRIIWPIYVRDRRDLEISVKRLYKLIFIRE